MGNKWPKSFVLLAKIAITIDYWDDVKKAINWISDDVCVCFKVYHIIFLVSLQIFHFQ
jgi:hypothetical protein